MKVFHVFLDAILIFEKLFFFFKFYNFFGKLYHLEKWPEENFFNKKILGFDNFWGSYI